MSFIYCEIVVYFVTICDAHVQRICHYYFIWYCRVLKCNLFSQQRFSATSLSFYKYYFKFHNNGTYRLIFVTCILNAKKIFRVCNTFMVDNNCETCGDIWRKIYVLQLFTYSICGVIIKSFIVNPNLYVSKFCKESKSEKWLGNYIWYHWVIENSWVFHIHVIHILNGCHIWPCPFEVCIFPSMPIRNEVTKEVTEMALPFWSSVRSSARPVVSHTIEVSSQFQTNGWWGWVTISWVNPSLDFRG